MPTHKVSSGRNLHLIGHGISSGAESAQRTSPLLLEFNTCVCIYIHIYLIYVYIFNICIYM